MSNFYFLRGNQKFGPVSAAQLKQLAAQGKLSPADKVAADGTSEWVEAGTLKSLFATATPQPPDLFESVFNEETSQPKADVASTVAPGSPATKPCPFCGETILLVAKKCKHCGEFLGHGSKSGKHSETSGSEKRILPLLLLWLFLGVAGWHAFHAGRTVRGIIYICLDILIVLLTSLVSIAAPDHRPAALFVLSIAVLLQGICLISDYVDIVTGAYKDGDGQPITKWV